ncbi:MULTISPECIES: hypothetical protein [unclassified Streptomyces]|uniref:hypothetical protein n=1 Tax=unclassified Streptomyces TaxID=2593676 RepID=UPI002366F5A2|nr:MULTISPECIES: hypothetical protein [unclassified Streptomyces]MDF3141242.1 hypothetical protein [Streptomyces sp. T21Q-yed]WDF40887.1 hypothetical protein PBV52_30970 [Streptomyces sp. T12]
MTEQPPPPGPGFGPPPPQFAPAQPSYPPVQPPYGPAQPPYAPAPPQPAPAPAGPEFLAIDKRNAVVVDASGVAFEMYGLTIEFHWPEVRSVHYKASPDGKALMVAVVHVDGRFYECVVEAKPRTRLQEWFPQLAWVLGHYRPTG